MRGLKVYGKQTSSRGLANSRFPQRSFAASGGSKPRPTPKRDLLNCVVRDLYGVIHHSRASFGIIVSRGGFTKGAVEFARDKPILFLDTDDLIAMQEGRDVLAKAFAASPRQ